MAFKLETFFNPHLGLGVKRLDAIVSVTCDAGDAVAATPAGKEVAFIVDTSGSMNEENRLVIAKRALIRCIEMLDETTRFSVISFNSAARVDVPMTFATAEAKRHAIIQVNALHPSGGTCMSKAINKAREQFSKGVPGYALFLTDGDNGTEDHDLLIESVKHAMGAFQCDCRGVGAGWKPDQLRMIADKLLGVADAAPEPSELEAQFREALSQALSRGVGEATLRLWSPKNVKITSIKQMSPAILEVLPMARRVDDKVIDVPTGAWSNESRDYHIAFDLEASAEGEEVLACRPSIVWKENGVEVVAKAQSPVVATWTADEGLSTRINPEVAHYTGQTELANAISEGLEQKNMGNIEEATKLLGRAAKIAADSGNEEATRRLSKVVDIVDADAGTVRMRRDAKAGDDLALDMGGTRTVRRRIGVTPNA